MAKRGCTDQFVVEKKCRNFAKNERYLEIFEVERSYNRRFVLLNCVIHSDLFVRDIKTQRREEFPVFRTSSINTETTLKPDETLKANRSPSRSRCMHGCTPHTYTHGPLCKTHSAARRSISSRDLLQALLVLLTSSPVNFHPSVFFQFPPFRFRHFLIVPDEISFPWNSFFETKLLLSSLWIY